MSHNISGIVVVDKPEDLTSAGVTNRLKKIEGIRKAGHTGTLDPFASGVLICTINQATRLSGFFLQGKKKYKGVMVLGVETDTQDATGKILQTAGYHQIGENKISAVFKRFEGDIQQVPPSFSALKHNGVPLYKYARKGTPVVKPARPVSISSLTIAGIALPEISFEVSCSSGTYIRTLCADIGKELGCGGHLKTLRRIESSGFGIHEAIPLDVIESYDSIDALKCRIVCMSDALRGMRSCVAGKELTDKIKYGALLTLEDIQWDSNDHFMKVISHDNELLAVVKRSENRKQYNYCCVFINP